MNQEFNLLWKAQNLKQLHQLKATLSAFMYVTRYSRMNQVKLWNTAFEKIQVISFVLKDHSDSIFLKAVFQKFLEYSCIGLVK